MINRARTLSVKKQAQEHMMAFEGCKHAIYGVCYVTEQGQIIEELATSINDIKYFYTEDSFEIFVDSLERKYADCDALNIYAVHRDD